MTDVKELVDELRGYTPFTYDPKTGVLPVLGKPYLEAADRIEQQAAEISKWHTVTRTHLETIEQQAARVAELEAELAYHGIYPNPIAMKETDV